MTEATTRMGLPLLVAGQGQKDITHNEALLALDALVHANVVSRVVAAPPAQPGLGDCWLIPDGASSVWAGAAGGMACWTVGGWRLLALPEGGLVWVEDEARRVRKAGSGWVADAPFGAPAAPVVEPEGGIVVDAEARAALRLMLDRLRQLGLLLP